jgi:hypothetical protein
MCTFHKALLLVSLLVSLTLAGCGDLVPRDTSSLLIPRLQKSEIIGFLAGLGTTFAAMPDLIAMLRRRSSSVPDSVGLLRPARGVAAGHFVECDRGACEFPECRRLCSLHAKGTGSIDCARMMDILKRSKREGGKYLPFCEWRTYNFAYVLGLKSC